MCVSHGRAGPEHQHCRLNLGGYARRSRPDVDRQASDCQPCRTERHDRARREVAEDGREVGHEQGYVVAPRQFRHVTQQDHRWSSAPPRRKKHGEVGVGSDQYVAVRRSVEDLDVGGSKQPDVIDVPRDMAGPDQALDQSRGQVGIEQELHAGRAIGTSRSFTIAAAYSNTAVTSSRSR